MYFRHVLSAGMWVHHLQSVPAEIRRGHWVPWIGVTGVVSVLGLTPSPPLQEQGVFLMNSPARCLDFLIELLPSFRVPLLQLLMLLCRLRSERARSSFGCILSDCPHFLVLSTDV